MIQKDSLSTSAFESEEQAPLPRANSPAIRTMRSDIDHVLKNSPPSIAQLIGTPRISSAAAKRAVRAARVYVSLGIFFVFLLIIGIAAFYFRESIFPARVSTEIKKQAPPVPFFATEHSRTFDTSQDNRLETLNLMADAMKEFERDGTIKRILFRISDTPDQHFMGISDFLDLYHIMPPEDFFARIDSTLMVFIHTTAQGTRLGFAVRANDSGRTLRDMLDWEPRIFADFKPLFFGAQLAPVTAAFEDRSYRNIDWRYLKLSSESDTGVGYTIFPTGNILIITTSKGLMETVINRLFDIH